MKPNWVTLDKTSGTEGVETVNISAMGNMGGERKSQIVAKTANGVQATLNIAQAGVPIVGAVRIYQDVSPVINDVTFSQNYGISYPEIRYHVEGSATLTFAAEFNIDAKYIHDVVNYLADTYPNDGWDKNAPSLVIRWSNPLGQSISPYSGSIPEIGRIDFFPSDFPASDLYIDYQNETGIAVSVINTEETNYVDLYKISFAGR
jgi:hypothetical protein